MLEAAAADDATAFPSALPAQREQGHSGVGHDPGRVRQLVRVLHRPAVRGPEISRPFDALVAEVEALAAEGVTEVTLLGQNVNSYGRDLTLAARRTGATGSVRPLFADLLRAVGEVDGIRRVRYTSPHPKDLRPDDIEAMATTRAVCEHLHLPLQSGSDRTLAAMHRGYNAERYLDRLAAARAAVDDLAVTTDLIVGFPGETDDDFERTLEVVAAAQYDSAYTFIFSPRPGTEAAGMVDQFVAPDVVRGAVRSAPGRGRAVGARPARCARRTRRGSRRRRAEQARPLGARRDAPGRTSSCTSRRRRRSGRARTPGCASPSAAAHYLHGTFVELLEPARHRIRIPVVAD